jgi:5,10-methylenetetrahydromethanopterin reductase
MKFGVAYLTHPRYVESAVEADRLGYDSIHLYDSPLVFSELFTVAGAIASRVTRANVALSVAVPFLRLPHVLASGVGTLNRFAPGRVQLGLGTGYTAAQSIDVPADSWATVIDTIRICRGILADRVTEVQVKDRTRGVRHLHSDLGYINVDDPVSIHVSAAGPKGMRVAAEHADGFYAMTAGQR